MNEPSVDRIHSALRIEGERFFIIDQTLLPFKVEFLEIKGSRDAAAAIQEMKVRGAPMIAVTAAQALYLEMKSAVENGTVKNTDDFLSKLKETADFLNSTRPTAVNLSNAMRQIVKDVELMARNGSGCEENDLLEKTKQASEQIKQSDIQTCRQIGELGASLIPHNARLLTHCNTGALATAGIGTAIGAFYTANNQGKDITVFAGETRPLLQGARLTAWELDSSGIRTVLFTDNMAAYIMKTEKIDLVMVGADRIAANGDTANKIGTLGLAILALHYNIPFYVCAPTTTLDAGTASGEDIIIENRHPDEVRYLRGNLITAQNIPVINPAFDVTPAGLITSIVLETGIYSRPYSFS